MSEENSKIGRWISSKWKNAVGKENIKMVSQNDISIYEIVNVLKEELEVNFAAENWQKCNDVTIALLSFERYFQRTKSFTALTIMITEVDNKKTANIVGSAGGGGLLNINWGAEGEVVRWAKEVLQKEGFYEVLE